VQVGWPLFCTLGTPFSIRATNQQSTLWGWPAAKVRDDASPPSVSPFKAVRPCTTSDALGVPLGVRPPALIASSRRIPEFHAMNESCTKVFGFSRAPGEYLSMASFAALTAGLSAKNGSEGNSSHSEVLRPGAESSLSPNPPPACR